MCVVMTQRPELLNRALFKRFVVFIYEFGGDSGGAEYEIECSIYTRMLK